MVCRCMWSTLHMMLNCIDRVIILTYQLIMVLSNHHMFAIFILSRAIGLWTIICRAKQVSTVSYYSTLYGTFPLYTIQWPINGSAKFNLSC